MPILFLQDDEQLIEMYKEYFEKKGYRSIVVRNGQKGLERAISEGPSLITLKVESSSQGVSKNHIPIILFTNNNIQSNFKIEPLLQMQNVMNEIKSAVD